MYCLIRDVLRFRNDAGTIVLRIFVGFNWRTNIVQECTTIYKNLLRKTARMLEISYESVKNIPNPVRIKMYS